MTASWKRYSRAKLAFETLKLSSGAAPTLCFSETDFKDVHPHQNGPMVITVVTMGWNVHKVLVDQGSLTDVMFWNTFEGLQIPKDQLKPFEGTLVAFNGGWVKVQCYIDPWTSFTDGEESSTVNLKYIVVNAPSSYNLLLGKPSLNQLGTVVSSHHLKMKLLFPTGKVITLRLDQKAARKC